MTIRLDVSGMLRAAVPSGPDADALSALAPRLQSAVAGAQAMAARGVLGFRELEAQATERQRVSDWASSARPGLDDVVVLGIGGSALGAVCLRTALLPRDWNARSSAQRNGRPRLHVLDNVDPRSVAGLLDLVNLPRTRVLVISKSGSTAETMAQYLLVRDRLRAAGLPLREHLAFITDPEKGALRRVADAEGIPTFVVPPNVGGRFSVLSPVGTLPAALLGLDIAALVAGAVAMRDRCQGASLREDPALAFAALQWRAQQDAGQAMHVLMPYSDALRDLGPWFVQLWAESLGKRTPSGAHVGPTPIAAVGATDQHAQVQLFMEGPCDKTVTFVDVEEHPSDVAIPHGSGDPAELAYLKDHSFAELLRAECRATAGALAQGGRPTMTLRVTRVDEWHLGGLFMFFELATVYAGQLYGVDPLDQPGVELGKQLTYYQFGHPDWQQMRAVWEALPLSDPDWVL
ncbi:MAG: glucose-6-phosphate isomerase [Gemmatimonadaceae bacterium]|nr:glucose-6-phosphate isomerase [Gemmatimonadaceae bacterium]MCW5826233.1 glucose-6-phosphate isomerase [Gemmatimonadaceae bacterium]